MIPKLLIHDLLLRRHQKGSVILRGTVTIFCRGCRGVSISGCIPAGVTCRSHQRVLLHSMFGPSIAIALH